MKTEALRLNVCRQRSSSAIVAGYTAISLDITLVGNFKHSIRTQFSDKGECRYDIFKEPVYVYSKLH